MEEAKVTNHCKVLQTVVSIRELFESEEFAPLRAVIKELYDSDIDMAKLAEHEEYFRQLCSAEKSVEVSPE